jgi:hypothetical protein
MVILPFHYHVVVLIFIARPLAAVMPSRTTLLFDRHLGTSADSIV